MVFTKIEFGTPFFDLAMDLRNRVLRIPLGLQFESADIMEEYKELHFGMIRSNQQLIACLSMRPAAQSTLKMRQVAVEPSMQGHGIGKKMVAYTERWCAQNNFGRIELSAREEAVKFYLSMNYEIVGDRFIEVTIPHYKMQKKIG